MFFFFWTFENNNSKRLSGDGQSLKEPVFPSTTSLKGILRYSYVFHSFLRGTGTRRVMAHKPSGHPFIFHEEHVFQLETGVEDF